MNPQRKPKTNSAFINGRNRDTEVLNKKRAAKAGDVWRQYRNMENGVPGGPNAGRGNANTSSVPHKLLYCGICKISCYASRNYRKHLKGKKHKKRLASLKMQATAQNTTKNPLENYHCELCDVDCAYAEGYTEHVKGAKHQKKIKLLQDLGIPLPADEPKMMAGIDVVPTSGSAATLATIGNDPTADGETAMEVDTEGGKIDDDENTDNVQPVEVGHIEELDFVAPPGQRHLAEGGDEQRRRSQNVDECENSNSVAPNFEDKNDVASGPENQDINPIGVEYREELKNGTGKILGFICNLCDCIFKNANAKEVHVNGRRHHLRYNRKFRPDLVVDFKKISPHQRRFAKARSAKPRSARAMVQSHDVGNRRFRNEHKDGETMIKMMINWHL